MPFDGGNISFALDKIDRVLALLSSPERWCKGAEAAGDGRRCIIGALRALESQALLQPVVLRSIAEVIGYHRSVQGFNDSQSTDHALMLHVLKRARAHVAAGDLATP